MAIISLYKIENLGTSDVYQICRAIEDYNFKPKPSKYNKDEIFIQYYRSEKLEDLLVKKLGKVLPEDELVGILDILKRASELTVVTRKVYAFVNVSLKTLEIYSGEKSVNSEILDRLGKTLKAEFTWLMNENRKKVRFDIRYLNGSSRYSVTVEKNKLRFNSNGIFQFRPRYEIRQMVQQIAETGYVR